MYSAHSGHRSGSADSMFKFAPSEFSRPLGHLSGADLPTLFPLRSAGSERGIIPRIHALHPVGAVCLLALLSQSNVQKLLPAILVEPSMGF
jgi:hypothetical protein